MIIKTVEIERSKQRVSWKIVKNQHTILMPIGDIHYGVEDFPKKKMKENIKWAIDRGCIFLGMGDYFDFASATQRAIMSGLRDTTSLQIDNAVRNKADMLYEEILQPTTGRWLGMLEGNHRWTFQDATTVDQYMCKLLRCDFLGTSTIIRIHPSGAPKEHPEADTVIFAHHGIGSSRKIGGHLNRVEDLLMWIDADLFLMGHSHAKVFAPLDYQVITPDGVHTHRTRLVARTGSWFKGYASTGPRSLSEPGYVSRGSYVEEKAYPPTSLGSPCFGIGYEEIPHSRYFKPAVHGSM